jgi:ribonuclease P protein component
MCAAPSAPLRLPRQRRLKQQRDFRRVRTQGERRVNGCLILNWLRRPAGTGSRVGVVTGRQLGDAVERSRARRLLREVFRLHQSELRQPVDLVLVARVSILGKKLGAVDRDFQAALRQAGLLPETE